MPRPPAAGRLSRVGYFERSVAVGVAFMPFITQCRSGPPRQSAPPAISIVAPAKDRPAASAANRIADADPSGAHRFDGGDGAPRAESIHLYVVAGSIDVLEKPAARAEVLGTIRAGGNVELAIPANRVGVDADCPEGRYAVLPRGFICADRRTTRDPDDRAAELVREYSLSSHAALPASYGVAEVSPVYMRIPTWDEQLRSEPGLEQHLHERARRREARAMGDVSEGQDAELDPVGVEPPDDLRTGSLLPLSPRRVSPTSPVTGFLSPGAPVAWVGEFDAAGRSWLLTPEFLFVPRDKVKRGLVSGFRGVDVPEGNGIAFVGHRPAHRYQRSADAKKFVAAPESFAPDTVISLKHAPPGSSEEKFVELDADGSFVRLDEVAVVPASLGSRWGLDGESRWVEVIAKSNVLLLHEASRVVFATLVSNGFETRRGRFRITSKHLTRPALFERTRSSGIRAEVPEMMLAAENREGVPASILFAGWWMSSWGSSNGGFGIALSPLDARRVFDFVSPELPEGWHSVRGEGTWVVIHD